MFSYKDFNKPSFKHILIGLTSSKVLMATRSKARTVFGHSNTRIMGSNLARGMDVCPRFSVLCCPVCR
jgi:hypothetical protein